MPVSKKFESSYCNDSLQDMLVIQYLKVFNGVSEKVECATSGKFSQEAYTSSHWQKSCIKGNISTS